MARREVEIKVIRVYQDCECGGKFLSIPNINNYILLQHSSGVNQYNHECDTCGKSETFDKTYPHLEYQEVT